MIKKFEMTMVVLFLVMLCPSFAAAEPQPIGELSYSEGRVDRLAPGGVEYVPLVKGENIYAGDTLRTKDSSRAEISFKDNSVVKVGDNSQMKVREYSIDASGKRSNADLWVDRGVIRAVVSKSVTGKVNFAINTPNSVGRVRGSDIGVSYLKSASTFLAMSGAIETANANFPDKMVLVQKGTTTFVPANAPAQEPRPYLEVEADRFSDQTAPILGRGGDLKPEDLSKAIITDVTGDVRVQTTGTDKWHRADLKESLGQGDKIETGSNGSLRMVLESGRIVEIKQDSDITIKQFKVEKNGSREDILETKKGELRARIEKLKAGSKFQVVTPTAIAAVRGTVLYLQVSPELTRAFFQAGQGSLTSLITNTEKLIDPGHNATANSSGNVTDPVPTTQGELQSLENGWNDQDQSYGYSAPDSGNTGDPSTAPPPPVNNNENNSIRQNITIVFDQIPAEVPQTPLLTGPTAEDFGSWGDPDLNDDIQFNSLYINDDGYFSGPVGHESGVINGVEPWRGTGTFTVSGTFTDDTEGGQSLLFNTLIGSHHDELVTRDGETFSVGHDTTPDGGAIFGFAAGTWSDEELKGFAAAIYADPSGNTGLMTSQVNGSFDQDAQTWSANGLFTSAASGHALAGDLDNFQHDFIRPGQMWGDVAGSVGGEFLTGYVDNGHVYFIQDPARPEHSELFGIYNMLINNLDTNEFVAQPAEWNVVLGGFGYFGQYHYSGTFEEPGTENDYGYWLALAAGNVDNDLIRGSLAGQYLTETQVGILVGDVTGLGAPDERAVAQSVGVFTGAPLTFSGHTLNGDFRFFSPELSDGGNGYSAWDDNSTDFANAGSLEGLIGSTGNVWSGEPTDVLFLGDFEMDNISERQPVVWGLELTSFNAYHNTATTIDGGAFAGFAVGISTDDSIKSFTKMIYIAPSGTATHDTGILSGDLFGTFFKMNTEKESPWGLWSMDGELTAESKGSTTLAPSDLIENLDEANMTASGSGSFADHDGTINLTALDGDALGLKSANWGVWGMLLGGTFNRRSNTASDFTVNFSGDINDVSSDEHHGATVWMGQFAGNRDTGGDITGHVNGVWISVNEGDSFLEAGTAVGKALGNSQNVGDSSTWQAISAGEFNRAVNSSNLADVQNFLLNNTVSIPVTETFKSILTTSSTPGITAPNADIRFFNVADAVNSGIWAALFNATAQGGGLPSSLTFSGPLTDPQTNASLGTLNATLNEISFNNDSSSQWNAQVTGSAALAASQQLSLSGSAAGTFNDGQIAGAGAGTWTKQ